MSFFGLVVVVAVMVVMVYNAAYASGKHVGSRKGYGVGFDRGRRGRGVSGCLVVLVVLGLCLIGATAWAWFP